MGMGGIGKLVKIHRLGIIGNRVKPARNPAKSTVVRPVNQLPGDQLLVDGRGVKGGFRRPQFAEREAADST